MIRLRGKGFKGVRSIGHEEHLCHCVAETPTKTRRPEIAGRPIHGRHCSVKSHPGVVRQRPTVAKSWCPQDRILAD